MATLHIVRRSPHMARDLERALEVARPGSHVLLVQDAVLAAAEGDASHGLLERAMRAGVAVHALKEDLASRAVARVAEGVDVVDYDGWVDLVEAHLPVAW